MGIEPTTFSTAIHALTNWATGTDRIWSNLLELWAWEWEREGEENAQNKFCCSLGAPLLAHLSCQCMCVQFRLSTVKLHIALNLQYAHGRGVHLSGYAQSIVLGLLFAACSRSPAATSKGNTPSLRLWATLFGCSRLPWACSKKQAHINWVIILTNGHSSLEHITD